jgi:hypothetical protein
LNLASHAISVCPILPLEPDVFFWRDSVGHEIDAIIDLGPKQIPIEIKSSQTVVIRF